MKISTFLISVLIIFLTLAWSVPLTIAITTRVVESQDPPLIDKVKKEYAEAISKGDHKKAAESATFLSDYYNHDPEMWFSANEWADKSKKEFPYVFQALTGQTWGKR